MNLKNYRLISGLLHSCLFIICFISQVSAQETRLLRDPDLSDTHVVFTYGSDIWIMELSTSKTLRLTSTAAVETDPHFSPDGKTIAFSSDIYGSPSVFTVPITGGDPTRITYHPSGAKVRGWTNDGKNILYASTRESAPARFSRLWTVPAAGGPSNMISRQWGNDGWYNDSGDKIILDRVRRWDSEWRAYRGGQNTPLIILDLKDQSEILVPNQQTTDIAPVWLDNKIYFLSDRDWTMNIWEYDVRSGQLNQLTSFKGDDIKSLAGHEDQLVYERSGFLHLYDIESGESEKLTISLSGDFPWANTQWEDVGSMARFVSLSPSGKRAIVEARGDIFTVPVEYGDARNITRSSGVADRRPIWSPKGDQVAWFSDDSDNNKNGRNYSLMIADQDGFSTPKKISIGNSKLAWEPQWSPDGKYIAFVDDDVRIKVLEVSSGKITLVDVGGTNIERGSSGIAWSPDSRMLAYAKAGSNSFSQIKIWSADTKKVSDLTDPFADASSPVWDADMKHMYFLASTDVALGSGWANTSAMTSRSTYTAYVVNLQNDLSSPFKLRSDEESGEEKKNKSEGDKKGNDKKADSDDKDKTIRVDFEGIDSRIMPLPLPARNYTGLLKGPEGTVFIAERVPNESGVKLHKFTLEDRESKEFMDGVSQVTVSADRKKMLVQTGGRWSLINTSGSNGKNGKSVKMNLQAKLDRRAEWQQIFEEAWRYERDYFYDPGMHGRDWDDVYTRYAPLIPHVRHRADLNYILDQVNGELSVGHSFVRGGDMPDTDQSKVGLLGADLVADKSRWKIERIYTTESWNPDLSSPLDEPGLNVKAGNYLVGINGQELRSSDNPFMLLDGTLDKQTVLHISDEPEFADARKVIVKPIRSENGLRQRAWVEDNRKMVDKLSDGRLAYVWVPNTAGNGFVSFNRYFFAQQDKEGAVIDERFNGGGLLDDYMVDLMTRKIRAALTNEVPDGKPMSLPAGILGPKVLLINELAGSGGDFFPWVFRQQKAGPLIGATTWGGLVKSSTHYRLIDGGSLTAPDNAVFDPVNNKWIAENEGVAPDIPVRQDARSLADGKDPQLARAVAELLKMLETEKKKDITPPEFPTPAVKKEN